MDAKLACMIVTCWSIALDDKVEREMAAHGAKGVQIELDRELQQLDDIISLVRGGKLSNQTAIGALMLWMCMLRCCEKYGGQGVSNKNDFCG